MRRSDCASSEDINEVAIGAEAIVDEAIIDEVSDVTGAVREVVFSANHH